MVPAAHRRTLALICASCSVLAALLYLFVPPYRSLESAAGDWLTLNPAARQPTRHPSLIYLGIGDESMSLDTLFPEDLEKSPTLRLMKEGWPWNRAVYAAIIDRLAQAGARAVVFDLLFPGEAQRGGDEEFRTALARHGDRVVIGSNLEKRIDDGGGTADRLNLKQAHVLPTPALIPSSSAPDPRVGFVNVYPDADGKVRRVHFRTTLREFSGVAPVAGEPDLLSLPARALERAGLARQLPPDRTPLRLRFTAEFLPLPVHEIFVEDQWASPPYSGGALFKDKIVLVGASGQTEDRIQTPGGTRLGPTIHLSAMNAALNGDFIHETPLWADLALIALGGALAWLLAFYLPKPMLRFAVLGALLLGGYVAIQLVFNFTGWLPAVVSPLLALGSSGLTWSVWEQVLDRRERARMRRTLERYVSRDAVAEILDNPTSYLNSLGGQRKNVSILFSDVRGFTTLTESADDPHQLVEQLNEYFNAMVGIVFAHRGTLDKFIGDAVMAHWGSIVSQGEKEDAINAVATAVKMRKQLVVLNEGWRQRGLLELSFGIGVNHGEAIVGNLGCEEKMEVSLIGDAVNLASRLEGATKPYHIDLCIGEGVEPLVRDRFVLRSVDLLRVKGKTKPVAIFAVLDERAALAEPPWLAIHEEAVQLYRRGDFAAAAARWRTVLAEVPGDGISELFLERCAALQQQPLPADWSGVFEMTSK